MTRTLALALILLAGPALAQQPPAQDPLETALAQQWQAAQTLQGNVGEAVGKMLEAWRRDRAALAKATAETEALRAKCGEACEAEK